MLPPRCILCASHSPPRCRGRAAPFGGGSPGTSQNIYPGCFHGESLSGFSTMRHIPQRMLRRQASTKINFTRRQSGPRPGPRCPVRRQVKLGKCAVEGRSSFSIPRPRPNWQAPRAAGAQSDGLVHIGFNLKPLLGKSFSLTCVDSSAKNKRMMSPRDDKSGRPGRAGCRRM